MSDEPGFGPESIGTVEPPGMRWAVVREEPCPYGCAVWIGPHLHGITAEGRIGLVVLGKDEAQRWGLWPTEDDYTGQSQESRGT